jgi:hypothetical protein
MKSHAQRAQSPYQKYAKRPYDYSAMYSRNPHLRRPLTGQVGAYDPQNDPLKARSSTAPGRDSALAA